MKVIAIFEEPKICMNCPCFHYQFDDHGYCMLAHTEEAYDMDERNENCTLRPLPKIVLGYPMVEEPYWDGWNDCLNEITGETE